MSLIEYFKAIRDAGYSQIKAKNLNYDPSDKDCGYRSGLRFLGIERTAETDDVANKFIYGKSVFIKIDTNKLCLTQMELFA